MNGRWTSDSDVDSSIYDTNIMGSRSSSKSEPLPVLIKSSLQLDTPWAYTYIKVPEVNSFMTSIKISTDTCPTLHSKQEEFLCKFLKEPGDFVYPERHPIFNEGFFA